MSLCYISISCNIVDGWGAARPQLVYLRAFYMQKIVMKCVILSIHVSQYISVGQDAHLSLHIPMDVVPKWISLEIAQAKRRWHVSVFAQRLLRIIHLFSQAKPVWIQSKIKQFKNERLRKKTFKFIYSIKVIVKIFYHFTRKLWLQRKMLVDFYHIEHIN